MFLERGQLMINKDSPNHRAIVGVFAFFFASQIAIAIMYASTFFGDWMGFGTLLIDREFLEANFSSYDSVMSAWGTALFWQFAMYILLIAYPKWQIYKRRVGLPYSFLLYLVGPWLVFFLLNEPARYIAFILIAAGAYTEAVVYPWLCKDMQRRQSS